MFLAKSDTSPVNGYCYMPVLVSVDSDNHIKCAMTLVTCDSYYLCLLENGASTGMSGHNCEEAQGQSPMKSLLASAVGNS